MTFSVVIPTYKRKELLLQAIDSASRQSLPPHEIIVVDDGGGDGVTEAVAAKFPNVRVLTQPNLGSSIAKNTGIAAASGEWICFLDDDDLWHPDKLKHVAAYLAEHPNCQALTAPAWRFATSSDGPTHHLAVGRHFVARDLGECMAAIEQHELRDETDAARLRSTCSTFPATLNRNQGAMTSAMCIRRDVLIRAGCFSPMHVLGEDWAMLVNVARLCDWHVLPMRLSFSRFHNTQISSGGVWDDVQSLAGFINAWYTGRPLPQRTRSDGVHAELSKYGPVYRGIVQGFFWNALRHGQLSAACRLRRFGRLLLPRWRDRMYSLLPPQITWRWEHYILGMHK